MSYFISIIYIPHKNNKIVFEFWLLDKANREKTTTTTDSHSDSVA